MPFLPAYAVCNEEPPADRRPRSVAHGSVGSELVVLLRMLELVREGFESRSATCTGNIQTHETCQPGCDSLKDILRYDTVIYSP